MITRRTFLKRAAGAGATVAMPNLIPASALGLGATPPSERVSLALIGCGGRGMGEGMIYTSSDRCQMVAVCDPREDRRTSAQQRFNAAYAARASSGAY
ncbi:MAG: hypothetical protein FJ388_25515, partial [Verrucomicrobia bacterium]|nr:hypothetical protein [Verrucomicrobiota bacterium]